MVDCIHDMNGNHVIQKLVEPGSLRPSVQHSEENLSPGELTFVVQAVSERATEMASHVYGCRIIQRPVALSCF